MRIPYEIQSTTEIRYCQEANLARWRMAEDIGNRLRIHREAMRLTQKEYGRLFGRDWKQVSAWENGHSRPRPSTVERTVSGNGWDLRMFTEGGPMPTAGPTSPAGTRTEPPPPSDREVWEMMLRRTASGEPLPAWEVANLVRLALKARRTSEGVPPANGEAPANGAAPAHV